MRVRSPLGRHRNAAAAARFGAAAVCALAAMLTAGCTVGTPFEDYSSRTAATTPAAQAPQSDDEIVTGSVKPASDNPLDSVLAAGDHAAVLTALGAALDPQSPGAPVTWTAAGGQGRGEARPTAMAKPMGDDICRPFALDGAGISGKFSAKGLACRNKRGDWRVTELSAGKDA